MMLSAAGQVGFGTALFIVLALLLGRWLDGLLGSEPIIMLTCVLVAIPLSLVAMVRTVLTAARASQRRSGLAPQVDNGLPARAEEETL
jgi:hypothetical protein